MLNCREESARVSCKPLLCPRDLPLVAQSESVTRLGRCKELSKMRTTFFALLFLSLLALVSATSPSRRRESNAQRLARGLAPARPRRLYDASRTSESSRRGTMQLQAD